MDYPLSEPFNAVVAKTDSFLSSLNPDEVRSQVVKHLSGIIEWQLFKPIHNQAAQNFPLSPFNAHSSLPGLGKFIVKALSNDQTLVLTETPEVPNAHEAVQYALYARRDELKPDWEITFLDLESRDQLSFTPFSDLIGIRELDGDAQEERIHALSQLIEYFQIELHSFLNREFAIVQRLYLQALGTTSAIQQRPPKSSIERRRARVKELLGLTVPEISEKLEDEGFIGCSIANINRDLKAIGAVTSKPRKRLSDRKGK